MQAGVSAAGPGPPSDGVIDLAATAPFRLGGLRVDPALVRVTGVRTETLEPRVMQVLIALAQARGAVVTRETLIERCWGGRIVGEDSIHRVIGLLRRLSQDMGAEGFRIETLTKVGYRLVAEVEPLQPAVDEVFAPAPARRRLSPRVFAAAVAAVVATGVVAFALTRHAPTPQHLRLAYAGYSLLSPDLPPAMSGAIASETAATLNEEGHVLLSAPGAAGPRADYALGGSVRRDGDRIRAVSRIDDRTTGAMLWARSFDYPAEQADRVPQWLATETSQMTRCGLAAVATHPRSLPDEAVTLILESCARMNYDHQVDQALDLARRVTIAAPDFSAGWSRRGLIAFTKAARLDPAQRASDADGAYKALMVEVRDTGDRALKLDRDNAEAWSLRAELLPPQDFAGREKLTLRALAARPLDCGCEFRRLAQFLESVGRAHEALAARRRAYEVLSTYVPHRFELARALAAQGQFDEAHSLSQAARRLSPDSTSGWGTDLAIALDQQDYAAAALALDRAKGAAPAPFLQAAAGAVEALHTNDPAARATAVEALIRDRKAAPPAAAAIEASLLARLDASEAALDAMVDLLHTYSREELAQFASAPEFAQVRRLPRYAETARAQGLTAYWRTGHKPDFCAVPSPPPLCATLR